MRVLWLSDGGVATGFARATHGLADRLVLDHGHEVHILATNYRGDYYDTPCRLYVPTLLDRNDFHGKSRIVEMLGKVEPDVVVILKDPFEMAGLLFRNEQYDPENMLLRYRPLVTYQPRDGMFSPKTWDVLRSIKIEGEDHPVSRQVAMSKFGQAQMPGSDLVYHGVDTTIFRQASTKEPLFTSEGHRITNRREAKEVFGHNPDSFVVLRIDTNSPRKDYASTWKALVPVMRKHDDIVAHFHCSGNTLSGGVSMPALWTRDLETASRFNLSARMDTYDNWDIRDLVVLMNAADLFVSTSQGEGFGLTIAEAMACGLPVIAQNVSAIPEVVGPGGVLIEPGFPVTAPGGQEMWAADVPAFSEAIEDLYLNQSKRRDLGYKAISHIRKTFDWDVEAAKMNAIISEEAQAAELRVA